MLTLVYQKRSVVVPGRRRIGAAAVCLVLFASMSVSESNGGAVRFNRQIRPILAEHCLECHGPDANKREADLRLDREDSAKLWSIVPHQPEDSELLRRVTTQDPDLRMPPPGTGKSLTNAQIELLRTWIAQGAPYEGHWAFEPIRRPEIPTPRAAAATPIDHFIVSALEARGLRLAPRVDRRQLIRRATFDLVGLPPTWEDVEAFVNDPRPDAFARVVDRLLDSPRYGERWGRYWLDLARYADTHGGSAIGFTRFAFSFTYRDYVIRALNDDLPYDRFIQEQLAADQLGLDENDPALAALGFLTVGMQYRNPHDVIDDQIDVVTRGLMGLTVACARCHDHKYDAIPTTDYYSLYATLASSGAPETLPFVGEPPKTAAFETYRQELARRERVRDDMARDQAAVMRSRLRMQVGVYLGELAKGVGEQDLASVFLSYRTDDIRPLILNRWNTYLANLPNDDPVVGPWKRLSGLSSEVATDPEAFAAHCAEMVASMRNENGDPGTFANQKKLSSVAPRWNPRVLDALADCHPRSLPEVADAYGMLFARIHEQWLRSLLQATLEAGSGGQVVPDEDPAHEAINSAIQQQLRRHLYHPGTPTAVSDELASRLLNRPVRDTLNGKQAAIHQLHLSSPGSPPRAMALQEREDDSAHHVFLRGNPIDRGPQVEPRFLSVFTDEAPPVFPAGRRRLALAQAIVAPDNPLTPRVIVNWVWLHHFGRGLVRTPDDFGTRGDPPTHPDLLEYLADSFRRDGWSLKSLHRRIMLSDVYQQSAVENAESRKVDPDNELLWRMPRRRLDLEAMRDAMLHVSGELEATFGGRPFDFLSRPTVPRRTVYGFVNRDIISSLASTFDAANPNACTARRPETNVPQQTLFALNSDFIQDRAAAFAERMKAADLGSDAACIRWMYQQAFSRSPSADELATAALFVQRMRTAAADGKKPDAEAWRQLAHVLLAANEFVFVD